MMSFREVRYGTAVSESPLLYIYSYSDVFCACFYADVFRYLSIKGDTDDSISSPVLFALYCGRSSRDSRKKMNVLQILVAVMAACCAVQGRNIRSRRFVNQPQPGLLPPGNNHLDIQRLMALLRNPMMMKWLVQGTGQQQQQQQQQQQVQGMGQIPQAEVTPQSSLNQGQPQTESRLSPTKSQTQVLGQTPAQNQGQGQQGQTNNGQTQQAPAPAKKANTPKTLDPMQQFMGYSNMFTDPTFLRYFQQFMRRVDRIKPTYRKGDFIPPNGLFPGGYVISPDGTDAEVRDIYGNMHSIDGGSFQA